MIVAGNKTLFMDGDEGIKVMQALGNETRILMLSLLSHRSLNLSALAEAINKKSKNRKVAATHSNQGGLFGEDE